MDISQYLFSFGHISFVAFIFILGILIYELFMLKKEHEQKSKPKIPQFDPTSNAVPKPISATPLHMSPLAGFPMMRVLPIIVTVILIIGIGGFIVINSFSVKQNKVTQPTVVTQEVQSTGIKLYSIDWVELKSPDVNNLKAGDTIIIGVATIPKADIDEARIRVNESTWTPESITKDFKSENSMYYKQYLIPEGFIELQIDAQLHSAKDGWLAE